MTYLGKYRVLRKVITIGHGVNPPVMFKEVSKNQGGLIPLDQFARWAIQAYKEEK